LHSQSIDPTSFDPTTSAILGRLSTTPRTAKAAARAAVDIDVKALIL
jgi:hypothetical protein